jgi:ABC-type multidrug transport system fused ATPase/permease subunit
VLETPVESGEGTAEIDEKSENIVEFRNVSFMYDGAGENSLENISFSVKKGETVGIIGGTGSGKTTLVNLIPAFYKATSGEVLVGGADVKEISLENLREKIAVVPQKAMLFKGTIKENMLWGKPDATDEEINKALEIAQAADFVAKKDGGINAAVEQGGRNFSGGQRQRLSVARAIIKNADILILDDSSSALDYATDAAMRKAIAANQGDTAVFIVSQRTSSIMHADKITVLDDGIATVGTHEELLKTNAVYKEIHLTQFEEGEE